MNVVTTVRDLRWSRAALDGSVGFVPTMGFLHDGHLGLVAEARRSNGSVAASIFVNPKQFLPHEDFTTYPRDLDRDLRLLDEVGVDLVFVPTVDEMYPEGFSTTVDVGPIGERLEGESRPGHFRAVATVVARLFGLVGPDLVYFGQKDAQQCVVVKKLVAELGLPLDVVVVPTVREPDGLALSSRNVYLDENQRIAARVLSRGLAQATEAFESGERNGSVLRTLVQETVSREPLASLDYVSVAEPTTLDELDLVSQSAIVSLAVRFGKTRLIDNAFLGTSDAFAAWCQSRPSP